jgi:hypothetical protein
MHSVDAAGTNHGGSRWRLAISSGAFRFFFQSQSTGRVLFNVWIVIDVWIVI